MHDVRSSTDLGIAPVCNPSFPTMDGGTVHICFFWMTSQVKDDVAYTTFR